jgi:hypothetical protein
VCPPVAVGCLSKHCCSVLWLALSGLSCDSSFFIPSSPFVSIHLQVTQRVFQVFEAKTVSTMASFSCCVLILVPFGVLLPSALVVEGTDRSTLVKVSVA